MAIAMLYEFHGMRQEQYDRFIQERYQGQAMPGVIAHAAGPTETGWWALDIYESEEAADRIGPPAIERLGEMGVEMPPTVSVLQVHNVQTQ